MCDEAKFIGTFFHEFQRNTERKKMQKDKKNAVDELEQQFHKLDMITFVV